MATKVKIGYTVKDQITGFKGTVTGIAEYITGCRQVLVAGTGKDDNSTMPESVWLDEPRVERVGETVFKLDEQEVNNSPGPDKPAPIK